MIHSLKKELRRHAPFTLLGAGSGIGLMLLLRMLPWDFAYEAFYTLHPLHVFLSGLVTASLYRFHRCSGNATGRSGLLIALVGYVGAVGVATLSDSVIPYLGEWLLGLPNRGVHIGFIDKWWLVNPLAIGGVALAFLRPTTKVPHAGHVLLSTYASLFHVMMAADEQVSALQYAATFVFLLLAVWLPASLSDIVFPVVASHESIR